MSIGGHQSAAMQNDEWLTPPDILKPLGNFDLDPCSPVNRPWDTATRHFNALDDGLAQPWEGRVWCNPPYGQVASKWLKRLAEHGNGIALIFARTETRMFFEHVWPKADGLLFLEGRLHFHFVDGSRAKANSGAPSVLIAYGSENARALKESGLAGHYVPLGESAPQAEGHRAVMNLDHIRPLREGAVFCTACGERESVKTPVCLPAYCAMAMHFAITHAPCNDDTTATDLDAQ